MWVSLCDQTQAISISPLRDGDEFLVKAKQNCDFSHFVLVFSGLSSSPLVYAYTEPGGKRKRFGFSHRALI